MKKLRTINFLVLTAFLLSLSVGVFAQEEEPPDFSLLECESGKRYSLQDILTTRVNIMIVTSITCGSCISELKTMDRIRSKYEKNMSVTTIFIDRGGESRVNRYLKYYNFNLDRFLVDPGESVPAKFNTPTIPTIIIFDKKGVERFRKAGFSDGDESLIITKAEEIIYGKKQGEGRRAKNEGIEDTTDQPESETDQGAGRVRKTAGCASTG